jgi:hypothetical protein
MKIVYQTYIDNQSAIDYPIEFLYKKHPGLIVYVSDEEHKNLLSKYNPIVVDQHVRKPNDISVAQNKCLKKTKELESPDFIVHVQADMYISSLGQKLIDDFCVDDNIGSCSTLRVQHVRLGLKTHRTYFGVTIVGSDSKSEFVGDGAYTNANSILGEHDDISPAYDIGYITIPQYYKHIKRHAITWSGTSSYRVDFDLDDIEVVDHALFNFTHDIKERDFAFFDENQECNAVIDGLDFRVEYDRTKQLVLRELYKIKK